MLIVGNKCDLEDERAVGRDQALHLAHQWGVQFMETSAKSVYNVSEVNDYI